MLARSRLRRFEQACHYPRNTRATIRARLSRNSKIIVSAYRSSLIKYLPGGGRKRRRDDGGDGSDEGRRRCLGLSQDTKAVEIGGVNEGETERETETEDERRRGRRIETENSISLPREPQGRR